MPEVKNTFIKSRMNKDLEARLLPNGEYRDAQNISVSKSEGDDVGAVENIRGNIEVTNFGLTDDHLEIIGLYSDVANNRLFCFITNYSDSSNDQKNHAASFSSAKCYITMYDFNSSTPKTLVSGNFLNFSKTSPVYGVNVLENLLFWTDNRNQPRKININKAVSNSSFYNTEDLISVLKYAPVDSVKFVEDLNSTNSSISLYASTWIDDTSEYLPGHFTAPARAVTGGTNRIEFGSGTGPTFVGDIREGIKFSTNTKSPRYYIKNLTRKSEWYTIFSVSSTAPPNQQIQLSSLTDPYTIIDSTTWGNITSDWSSDVNDQDTYAIAVKNPYYNPNFTGDKNFLKDKFVRFSYRFKYSDGEYSLAAPFTQPSYLSNQYGNWLENDEEETLESGIVKFFENQITTVGCCINLPYDYDLLQEKLDISAIDILYKDSNNTNISVLETIESERFHEYIGSPLVSKNPTTLAGGDLSNSTFEYDNTTGALIVGSHYPTCVVAKGNGKKVRLQVTVTDAAGNNINNIKCTVSGSGFNEGDIIIIPANELGNGSPQVKITLSGGDLVGWTGTTPNFEPTHVNKKQFVYQYKSTSPYKVLPEKDTTRVHDKAPIKALTQEVVGNRVLYGNYVDRNNAPSFLNYYLKINEKFNLNTTQKDQVSRIEYPMQTLKQNRTYQVGVVLVDRYGRASNVLFNNDINNDLNLSGRDSTIFSGYSNSSGNSVTWPGNSIKVIFNSVIPNVDQQGGLYSASNPTGWYSYRIVVKQQDQDYYNVYVPGIVKGSISWVGKARPNFLTGKSSVSNIALHGDNINKIPRNLTEIGPLDENFGSDTVLYARVNPNSGDYRGQVYNTQTTSDNALTKISVTSIKRFKDFDGWAPTKGNFYPGQTETTGSSSLVIAPWYPYNVSTVSTPPTAFSELYFGDIFYKPGENPFIATLNQEYALGTTPTYQTSVTPGDTDSIEVSIKSIGVFETKPTFSNINILWETTTSGLISELNTDVQNSVTNGLGGVTEFAYIHNENMVQNDWIILPEIEPVDEDGNTTGDAFATITIARVEDLALNDITNKFQIVQTTAGIPGSQAPRYRIRLKQATPDFVFNDPVATRTYNFYLNVSANGQTTQVSFQGKLVDTAPYINGDVPYDDLLKAKIRKSENSYDNSFSNWILLNDLWQPPAIGSGLNSFNATNSLVSKTVNNKTWVYWDISSGYNGSQITIHDFGAGENWALWEPQFVTSSFFTAYSVSNALTPPTIKSYTIQNGSSNFLLRKEALVIDIVGVDFTGAYAPVSADWEAESGKLELPFIVDNSGLKIVTSKLNPPSKGGNYGQANGPRNATYRIRYRLKEDCVAGQVSQIYNMYVRFGVVQVN